LIGPRPLLGQARRVALACMVEYKAPEGTQGASQSVKCDLTSDRDIVIDKLREGIVARLLDSHAAALDAKRVLSDTVRHTKLELVWAKTIAQKQGAASCSSHVAPWS
jgi:hypothetical protein